MKRNYYIMNNGRISRKDNTLFYVTDDDKRHIPVNDIDAIYCFGENDFNSKAVNFLAQNNITIHLFNYYGYYTGSFYPREYLPSGFLLVKQVEKYSDSQERLKIAKEFIETASFNILKNVKYYANRKEGLEEIIDKIEEERKKISDVQDIATLMGIEGRMRDTYYRGFNVITNHKFEFYKREKRPPDNAMNALISFGNSLMYATVLGEIYHTQLNPTVSYLHEPGARRFSLSLDISEVFKPIIVERLIFKLINEGMIKDNHFTKELNFCHLNDVGKKIFLKQYDEKLQTTVKHRNLGRHVSYRRLIRLECYRLIKHISDIEPYEGFKMWW
ncbi:MAG: type I-B CRISPR-associated endonuclease Cas1b [Clostridia bacterium]|nr:type I-B CRISPR-associated endonuclease Cas1b [Clostridia bacterium]